MVTAHIGAFALGWIAPPGVPSPFVGPTWFQTLDFAYNLGGIAQGFFEKYLEWSEKGKSQSCEQETK